MRTQKKKKKLQWKVQLAPVPFHSVINCQLVCAVSVARSSLSNLEQIQSVKIDFHFVIVAGTLLAPKFQHTQDFHEAKKETKFTTEMSA